MVRERIQKDDIILEYEKGNSVSVTIQHVFQGNEVIFVFNRVLMAKSVLNFPKASLEGETAYTVYGLKRSTFCDRLF